MRQWLRICAVLVFFSFYGTAVAAEWRMESMGSRLAFQTSYQGDPVPGVFRKFDTHLRFDPAKPAAGRLEVTVNLSGIDLDSAEMNDAVRTAEWFDVKRFQQARFVSTDIRHAGSDRYVAKGTLELKGVSRPVEVPFNWAASGRSAEMKGELMLDRTTFGIGSGEWKSGETIGLQVRVSFDVQLRAN